MVGILAGTLFLTEGRDTTIPIGDNAGSQDATYIHVTGSLEPHRSTRLTCSSRRAYISTAITRNLMVCTTFCAKMYVRRASRISWGCCLCGTHSTDLPFRCLYADLRRRQDNSNSSQRRYHRHRPRLGEPAESRRSQYLRHGSRHARVIDGGWLRLARHVRRC